MNIESLLNESKIQNITYHGYVLTSKFDESHQTKFSNSIGFHIGSKYVRIFSSKTALHSILITGIQNQSQLDYVLSQLDCVVLSIEPVLINIKTIIGIQSIDLYELSNKLRALNEFDTIVYDNLLHSSLRIKNEHCTLMLFRTGTILLSVKSFRFIKNAYKKVLKLLKLLNSPQIQEKM